MAVFCKQTWGRLPNAAARSRHCNDLLSCHLVSPCAVASAKTQPNALSHPGMVCPSLPVKPDVPGCFMASRQVARSHQDQQAMSNEILGDLQPNFLVGPGDKSDGFVLHDDFMWLSK